MSRADANTVALGVNSLHGGSLEDDGSQRGGGSNDAQTRPIRIELRTPSCPNRSSGGYPSGAEDLPDRANQLQIQTVSARRIHDAGVRRLLRWLRSKPVAVLEMPLDTKTSEQRGQPRH